MQRTQKINNQTPMTPDELKHFAKYIELLASIDQKNKVKSKKSDDYVL